VKERKGPFGLMVGGIVDSVVQTARRRAQDREPRAVVYDAAGRPRLLKADDAGRDELITSAARLIELAGPPSREQAAADDEAGADERAAAEAETRAEAAAADADPDAADAEPLP
jgi:hypothetical protein